MRLIHFTPRASRAFPYPHDPARRLQCMNETTLPLRSFTFSVAVYLATLRVFFCWLSWKFGALSWGGACNNLHAQWQLGFRTLAYQLVGRRTSRQSAEMRIAVIAERAAMRTRRSTPVAALCERIPSLTIGLGSFNENPRRSVAPCTNPLHSLPLPTVISSTSKAPLLPWPTAKGTST